MHGLGQERDKETDKGFNLCGLWEVFFQFFYISQQMSITILDLNGGFIVSIVAINYQDPRQFLVPENTARHTGRAGVLEGKQTGFRRAKEPCIAALAIISPTGLIGVFSRRKSILSF